MRLKSFFISFLVIVRFVSTAFSETVDDYMRNLVGLWEEKGNPKSFMQVFSHNHINIGLNQNGELYSLGGEVTADKNIITIILDDYCYLPSGDLTSGSKFSIPYQITNAGKGKNIITLTIDKKRFILTQLGFYNLLIPGWQERPEFLHQLSGHWQNGDNMVLFANSSYITYSCTNNGSDWYSERGIFSADDHNIYVTTMKAFSDDGFAATKPLVFPYTIVKTDEQSYKLTMTIEGSKFEFTRLPSSFSLSPRRQTELDGLWKSEKKWEKPSDWNIKLQFLEDTFIVKLWNNTFSYTLLGYIFYENGLMYISSNSYTEVVALDEEDFGREGIMTVYDYAAFYELPEYIFFGAARTSPYQALCNYRLSKNTLIISAYGKEIELLKQKS